MTQTFPSFMLEDNQLYHIDSLAALSQLFSDYKQLGFDRAHVLSATLCQYKHDNTPTFRMTAGYSNKSTVSEYLANAKLII